MTQNITVNIPSSGFRLIFKENILEKKKKMHKYKINEWTFANY